MCGGGGVIDCTGQIFALDSAVLKTKNLFRLRRCFLTYTIYHYRDTIKSIKGIYHCPIKIIKRLTDKGQFQYLTKLKRPRVGNYLYGELPVYNTISFTKIKINILS